MQESGVVYQVRLSNGQRVRVHIFVVYDRAQEFQHAAKPGEECYQWTCVQRASCKKGCEGPILRAIQRYGRLGRCGLGQVPGANSNMLVLQVYAAEMRCML